MDAEIINRAYLEKLSFSDLSKLADDFGVDVPEDLNRRFLIAELLELAEEAKSSDDESMIISAEDGEAPAAKLPKNYNETQISCILRNPAWAFVFWNINDTDSAMIKSLTNCNLMIRVCVLSAPDKLQPEEAFEINASTDTQEQYVLLPAGSNYIRVELVYVAGNTGKVLAFTPVIEIPSPSKQLNDFQPGKESDYSEIINLSGMEEILVNQYKNHRHSFS